MIFDFDSLYQNGDIKEYIAGAVSSGNVPSTFIVEGDAGSGRRTLVKLIFETLSCKEDVRPCGKCASCRRIENGNASDIRYFGPQDGKKSIGVETSRMIKEDCMIGPTDGELKFYVVAEADKLTPAAQNALLKITEEPPAFAKFFFICESSLSLLATLRSRSTVLRMQRIDDRALTDYLIDNEKAAARMYNDDRERFNEIIAKSEGSIGKAKELLRKKNTGDSLPSAFVDAVLRGKASGILEALLAFPEQRSDYKDALSAVRLELRDRVAADGSDKVKLLSGVYSLISGEYANCALNTSVQLSKRYLSVKINELTGDR